MRFGHGHVATAEFSCQSVRCRYYVDARWFEVSGGEVLVLHRISEGNKLWRLLERDLLDD